MSSFFDALEDLLGTTPTNHWHAKNGSTNLKNPPMSIIPTFDLSPTIQPNDNHGETKMSQNQDLIPILEKCFEGVQIDDQAKMALIRTILLNVKEFNSTSHIQKRLDILYQHEKNYLSLIKEFKEEIKFIGSMQEELRKERSRFFSDTLKEVTKALDDAKVTDEVASQWLQELVGTYTRSLDLSSGLIEEHTADTIGEIREHAQSIVNPRPAEKRDEESI